MHQLGKGSRTEDVSRAEEPDLELGEERSTGKLLVVLAKLLLAGFHVTEELAPAYRPCDTSPSCPEVLHPAQGTTVQQNPGLGYCCKGKGRHFYQWLKHRDEVTPPLASGFRGLKNQSGTPPHTQYPQHPLLSKIQLLGCQQPSSGKRS